MKAVLSLILATLKKILLPLLGEKLVAYISFSLLTYLATLSKTNIDDNIVKEWKDTYYGEKPTKAD